MNTTDLLHRLACASRFTQIKKGGEMMKKGFTLIEMVVTIAVIAIVAAAIIVGIAPAKRIADAQDSAAKQNVRATASAVEACLSYTTTAGAVNTVTICKDATAISTGGSAPGAPFARTIPSAVSIVADAGNTVVCVNGQGSGTGASTVWWQYKTNTGQVTSATGASAPACS